MIIRPRLRSAQGRSLLSQKGNAASFMGHTCMLVTRAATSKPVDECVSHHRDCDAERLETESRATETGMRSETKESRAFHVKDGQDKTRQVEHYLRHSLIQLVAPAQCKFRISDGCRSDIHGQSMSDEARRVEGSKSLCPVPSQPSPATHARSR